MDELKAALQAFGKKELALPRLVQLVAEAQRQQAGVVEELRQYGETLRDQRKLSMQDFAKLEVELLQLDKSRKQSEQNPSANRAVWRDPAQWPEGWEQEKLLIPEPEAVVKYSYRLRTLLGQGKTGETWEVFDLLKDERAPSERHLALKLLNPEFRRYPDQVRDFAVNFEPYQALNHPNLARVYDIGRVGSSVFVSMELLTGVSLNRLIEQSPTGLPPSEVQIIAEGMARALTYAYQQGVKHLDITPDNVFYDPVRKTVKVLELGLIGLIRSIGQKQPDPLLTQLERGADAYTSGQVLQPGGHTPLPSDGVYTLACLTYELLSGVHPYGRKTALEARDKKYQPNTVKSLPPKQWRVLLNNLSFEPSQRSPTPARFIAELFPRRRAVPPHLGYAALALAAVALLGGVYVYFNVWHYHSLREGILRGDRDSVVRLEGLSAVEQVKVLDQGGSQVRAGLLEYYQQQPEPDAVLAKLEGFNPELRAVLLQDPAVRAQLSRYAESRLERQQAADEFAGAQTTLARLEKLAPDLLPFAERQQRLQQQRAERLQHLAGTYQDCLHNVALPLHDRTACIVDSRAALATVDPAAPVLQDPQLAATYQAEAEKLLAANAYDLARQVLEDWVILLPAPIPQRDSLLRIVTQSQMIERYLQEDNFAEAAVLVNESLTLYPDSPRFLDYKQRLKTRKTERLQELSQKYREYRAQGGLLPNRTGEDLFDVRQRIQHIDPAHDSLKDPSLHADYFNTIVQIAAEDGDTLSRVRALFNAWKPLLTDPAYFTPADQEQYERAVNRVALRYLLRGKEFDAAGDSAQALTHLEYALGLSPVESVQRKLLEQLAPLRANSGPPPGSAGEAGPGDGDASASAAPSPLVETPALSPPPAENPAP